MAGSTPQPLRPARRVLSEDIEKYEGLVFKTATLYERKVELELDDLRQIFRIKVWRALESFDPAKSTVGVDRYVFSCLVNQGKDLLRKRRRNDAYIEDLAPLDTDEGQRNAFEAKYLALEPEEVFKLVEGETALVPNTLTGVERRVVCLLYADYKKGEIQKALSIGKREFSAAMAGVRVKMADWSPSALDPGEGEETPGRDERLAA